MCSEKRVVPVMMVFMACSFSLGEGEYNVRCAPYLFPTRICPKKEAASGAFGMRRLTTSFSQGLFAQRGELVHLVATETGSEALVDLQDARVYLL